VRPAADIAATGQFHRVASVRGIVGMSLVLRPRCLHQRCRASESGRGGLFRRFGRFCLFAINEPRSGRDCRRRMRSAKAASRPGVLLVWRAELPAPLWQEPHAIILRTAFADARTPKPWRS
jgi:hypothetical protein